MIYQFLYDSVKPKCEEKAKLCYMDRDSLTFYIKTEDIYVDIAKEIEVRFYTSKYELEESLPTGKNVKSYWINVR